jgi:opacity protein-like surface antigen
MRLSLLVSAAALVGPLVAESALAQTADNRFYASVFGGAETLDDESITGANAAGQARNINVEFGDGSVFGAAVGVTGGDMSFGRFRGEFETAFRQSDVEALALNGTARQFNPSSEVSITTAMVNAYYDTPVFWERVRAFGGVGFGIAGVDHEIRYLVANAAATGGNLQILLPSSETTYAYQLILGSEIELSPSWSLSGDVRYLDVGDVQVERYIGNSILNGVATNNGTLDSVLDADLTSISATIGLRFKF